MAQPCLTPHFSGVFLAIAMRSQQVERELGGVGVVMLPFMPRLALSSSAEGSNSRSEPASIRAWSRVHSRRVRTQAPKAQYAESTPRPVARTVDVMRLTSRRVAFRKSWRHSASSCWSAPSASCCSVEDPVRCLPDQSMVSRPLRANDGRRQHSRLRRITPHPGGSGRSASRTLTGVSGKHRVPGRGNALTFRPRSRVRQTSLRVLPGHLHQCWSGRAE
jgi:hypothetical protein